MILGPQALSEFLSFFLFYIDGRFLVVALFPFLDYKTGSISWFRGLAD